MEPALSVSSATSSSSSSLAQRRAAREHRSCPWRSPAASSSDMPPTPTTPVTPTAAARRPNRKAPAPPASGTRRQQRRVAAGPHSSAPASRAGSIKGKGPRRRLVEQPDAAPKASSPAVQFPFRRLPLDIQILILEHVVLDLPPVKVSHLIRDARNVGAKETRPPTVSRLTSLAASRPPPYQSIINPIAAAAATAAYNPHGTHLQNLQHVFHQYYLTANAAPTAPTRPSHATNTAASHGRTPPRPYAGKPSTLKRQLLSPSGSPIHLPLYRALRRDAPHLCAHLTRAWYAHAIFHIRTANDLVSFAVLIGGRHARRVRHLLLETEFFRDRVDGPTTLRYRSVFNSASSDCLYRPAVDADEDGLAGRSGLPASLLAAAGLDASAAAQGLGGTHDSTSGMSPVHHYNPPVRVTPGSSWRLLAPLSSLTTLTQRRDDGGPYRRHRRRHHHSHENADATGADGASGSYNESDSDGASSTSSSSLSDSESEDETHSSTHTNTTHQHHHHHHHHHHHAHGHGHAHAHAHELAHHHHHHAHEHIQHHGPHHGSIQQHQQQQQQQHSVTPQHALPLPLPPPPPLPPASSQNPAPQYTGPFDPDLPHLPPPIPPHHPTNTISTAAAHLIDPAAAAAGVAAATMELLQTPQAVSDLASGTGAGNAREDDGFAWPSWFRRAVRARPSLRRIRFALTPWRGEVRGYAVEKSAMVRWISRWEGDWNDLLRDRWMDSRRYVWREERSWDVYN